MTQVDPIRPADGYFSASSGDLIVESIYFVLHRRSSPSWTIRDVMSSSVNTLVWASAGEAHYVCGDQKLDVREGELLLFPAGTPRSATTNPIDPWVFDAVGFRLVDEHGNDAPFRGLPLSVNPRDAVDLSTTMHELDQHWHAQTPGWHLRCHGIVMRLLGVYINAAAQVSTAVAHRPALDSVIELLGRNQNRWYTVDDLAARTKLSPSRFRVLFQRATGMSVVRYQNSTRIRRACGLLRSGEHTVTEVAELLGFNDVYYFSRLFKKMTGFTPSSHISR